MYYTIYPMYFAVSVFVPFVARSELKTAAQWERRKSDINLSFAGISNKKLSYIIAFESLSNLL